MEFKIFHKPSLICDYTVYYVVYLFCSLVYVRIPYTVYVLVYIRRPGLLITGGVSVHFQIWKEKALQRIYTVETIQWRLSATKVVYNIIVYQILFFALYPH